VVAINKAVDRGDVGVTAAALRNPAALLSDLQEALMSVYQEMLQQARRRKAESAACRVRLSFDWSERVPQSGGTCVLIFNVCVSAWRLGGQRYVRGVPDAEGDPGAHQHC